MEAVLAERPDTVVLATGARPGLPSIPGVLDSPAVDAFDVLRRAGGGVRRALVIGGGMLGVGVAHALAERGVEVLVAEPTGELAAELGIRSRWRYVAGLRARSNVTVLLGTTVEALVAGGALLRTGGEEVRLDGLDLIVPTRLMVPVSDLGEALAARPGGPALFTIGDGAQPRTAFDAMQEAAALGHRL